MGMKIAKQIKVLAQSICATDPKILEMVGADLQELLGRDGRLGGAYPGVRLRGDVAPESFRDLLSRWAHEYASESVEFIEKQMKQSKKINTRVFGAWARVFLETALVEIDEAGLTHCDTLDELEEEGLQIDDLGADAADYIMDKYGHEGIDEAQAMLAKAIFGRRKPTK